MTKKIIIKGNFTIEGDTNIVNGVQQPLEYLELDLFEFPIMFKVVELKSKEAKS